MADLETYVTNGAESTVSSLLNSSDATVNVSDTSSFPAVPFYATIDPAKDASREVVLVTGKTATTFTATRGQDGTTGVEHDEGAIIAVVPVAAHFTDLHDRVDAVAADVTSLESDKFDTADHTKATHDALSIDAATVDGMEASDFLAVANVVGVVTPFAGSSAPSGWLLCDGAAVSRTTYADLFSAIGTTWGSGDGSTTFNVPDLAGTFPVGVGTLGGNTYALGDTGGEAEHTLTAAEMPSHTHSTPDHTHGVTVEAGSGTHSHGGTSTAASGDNDTNATGTYTTPSGGGGTTGSTGSGDAHENRPPFLALNFIIFAGA